MNPNAPFHQPEVMRDITLVRWASNKMWSFPKEEEVQVLNAHSSRLDEIKVEMTKRRILSTKKRLPTPRIHFPSFTFTPPRTESNISSKLLSPIRVDINQGLKVLDDSNGTNSHTTDVYLQFICDFANRWHTKLTGKDRRSPNADPMFYTLDQHFHDNLMKDQGKTLAQTFPMQHLTRTQFWKLRYLFLPISFKKSPQPFHHVALCVVSPEARTVEYICSGGDNGMYFSERTAGSKCVPSIFAWLAEMLQTDPFEGFMPYEWRFRSGAGFRQLESRKDCGIYTVTHAMALAFGWGLQTGGAFPADHQAKINLRRARYVQDLMYHGFDFYDPEFEDGGPQYYPLLDTLPSSEKIEGFLSLHPDIISALPTWAQNRRACYLDCPSKIKLLQHCLRNARFYPGYEDTSVSGAAIDLASFLTWVEQIDRKRKSHRLKSLPYPQHQPRIWIDPRHRVPRAVIEGPLWGHT